MKLDIKKKKSIKEKRVNKQKAEELLIEENNLEALETMYNREGLYYNTYLFYKKQKDG